MSTDGTTSQAWSACSKVTLKHLWPLRFPQMWTQALKITIYPPVKFINWIIIVHLTLGIQWYVPITPKIPQEDVVLFKANCLKCIRWTTSNVPCYPSQSWSKTIRLLCSILSIVLLLPTPPTSICKCDHIDRHTPSMELVRHLYMCIWYGSWPYLIR